MTPRHTFTLLVTTAGVIFLLSQGAPVPLTAAGSRPTEGAVGVTKGAADRALSIQSGLAAPRSRGERAAQGGTNDSCTTPETIFDGLNPFSTVGNTTDGLPHVACQSDGQTYLDDWFVYTATCTGDLTASTCDNADYDTDIVVYAGCQPIDWACPPGDAELLDCNDDAAGCLNFTSEVTVPVTAGNCYTLRVGGWKGDDQGTGTLTLTCGRPVCGDDILSAGEECDDGGTEPADCVKDFCESDCTGAICSVCPLCDGDECENSPGSCHLNDRDGHGEGGIVGATSDLDSSFTVADNFVPTTDTVTEVCWWGIYIDFAGPTDCGPGEGDNFTVTYFTDVDGLPGGVIASHSVAIIDKTVSGFVPTSIGPVQTYGYTATHPAVSVTPNQCHWIEIVNDTTGSVCTWLWSTAAPGDGLSAQDDNGNGYEPGEEQDFDQAFCLDSKVGGDTIVYVDADAIGLENGTSWPDAFTDLQDALGVASCAGAGSQIWVAASTQPYKPDRGSGDRTATFQLLSGVGVYGGFAGFESTLEERVGLFDDTILSGDIGTPDDNSDNTYHVVTGSETDDTAVLDGFEITAGNAVEVGFSVGGGLYIANGAGGSLAVRNCTFRDNVGSDIPPVPNGGGGGAIYLGVDSNPTITACKFLDNFGGTGGAVFATQGSSGTFVDCLFEGNDSSGLGGAFRIHPPGGGIFAFTNCDFRENTAEQDGGGMWIGGVNSAPVLTGCTFTGNTASSNGGAIASIDGSSATLIGCTFVGNSSGGNGGAVSSSNATSFTFDDCTFQQNTAGCGGAMANSLGPLAAAQALTILMTRCVFADNSSTSCATGGGGALINTISTSIPEPIYLASNIFMDVVGSEFYGNSSSEHGGAVFDIKVTAKYTNCVFSGNSTVLRGGVFHGRGADNTEFTNCTFSENSAGNEGGVAWLTSTTGGGSLATFVNAILWNNPSSGGQVHLEPSNTLSHATVGFSDVQGGQASIVGPGGTVTWNPGNIDVDPLFTDVDGADDVVGTEDDDLRLVAGSPCVDSANNNAVPADTTDLDDDGDTIEPIPFDLDGNDRFIDDPDTVDTGVGPAPVVDMGAFEFLIDCNNNGIPDDLEIVPPVLFVDDDAAGANDGSSWDDALMDLQFALCMAENSEGAITEIWVAQGMYVPSERTDSEDPRSATFQLQSGVALYGGFAGFETSLEERVGLFDQTILNGDLDGNDADVPCTQNFPDCNTFGDLCVDNVCIIRDNNSENSFHVVIGSGTDATAILDGFTITAGNANGFQPDNQGGGMFNAEGNPTVNNCTFTANSADNSGGGMTNRNNSSPTLINCTFTANSTDNAGGGMINFISSNPTVTDCTFSGNRAGSRGGGMTNEVNSSPTLTDCTFNENSSTSGGGMSNNDSSPTLTNCAFIGNRGGGMNNVNSSNPTVTNCAFIGNSAGVGGAMSNIIGSEPTLTNCTFSGNSADIRGGGMFNHSTGLTLTNCTFSGNSAASEGGGMFNTSFSTPAVSNSIFWQNSDAGGMDESAQIHVDSGAPVVNYSLVQGGWSGAGGMGNLDADPLLADADGADDMVGTEDDDLRLSAGSPCIDSANNNAVPADTTDLDDDGDTIEPIPFDLDGESRFIDDANTPDCPQKGADCGTPPIVDMGAYEFGSDCNGNGLPDVCDLDCGAKGGACNLPGCGLSIDCNGNGLPDECEVPPLGPPEGDCNGNGVPDECDIADMTSDDCNGNGIPDECEVPPLGPSEADCNGNGVPDECDIADMTSDDCNSNGTPDECELPVSSGGLCTEGCASDCDGNGVIDSCELADCPPDTPFCDDCNVNGTLDGCDVDPLDPDGNGQVSNDEDEDGVPDECVEPTVPGSWSGDIWGLGGDYPDNDPKNPSGVPDLSVTLDGLTVFVDVTVQIPSLRLLNAASLDVTQDGEQGDLTIFDPTGVFDGNLLIEGTLNIDGEREIDAAGTLTVGTGGVYKSIFGFTGSNSGDLMADGIIVKCGGTLSLSGTMTLSTPGDLTLQDSDGKGDCTPPDFEAGDDSTAAVGGDFDIQGPAFIDYTSSQPLILGGNFDNQSTDAENFNWSSGGITLNGPLHTIEAAGEDRGPWPAGLENNFAIGTLTLGAESFVQVVDVFDNQQDGVIACDEALYVELLEVGANATLLTEGCPLYYGQLINNGSIPGLRVSVLEILESAPADFNGDGVIDAFDLAFLLGNWGDCPEPCTPGEPAATCTTDLNGDCETEAFDLAFLLGSWG